jgi:hypothetical protein
MNARVLGLGGLALLASALSTGCASYVPFTAELRDEHHLKVQDLENLQFYNSHTITLRREIERGGREITGAHTLRIIAGKQIEEVVIEEHTPGVVVGANDKVLRVSFEEGTFFEFALHGGVEPLGDPVVPVGRFAEPPNPFPGNDRVAVNDPEPRFFGGGSGNFWLVPEGNPTITFQGQSWDAVEDSALAHLVISTESLEDVEEQKTVLKGRKL